MRVFLFTVCVFIYSLTYAQPGGGGGGRQGGPPQGGGQGGQQQQHPEMREFNASEVAGIFSYDVDEAVKKIKIKKDKNLVLKVRRTIDKYNIKVQEIEILNKDNFDTLNVYVNAVMKSSMANRGQGRGNNQQRGGGYGNENNRDIGEDSDDPVRKVRELVREKIEPAKRAVKEEEGKLNEALENMLDEKQYKKWLKYQEQVKEELNPKPQSNNQNGGQMRSGGGQGGPPGGGGIR